MTSDADWIIAVVQRFHATMERQQPIAVVKVKRSKPRKIARPKPVPTHCQHGHEYTTVNTAYDRDGYRKCRTCRRRNNARRSAARSAQRKAAREAAGGHRFYITGRNNTCQDS